MKCNPYPAKMLRMVNLFIRIFRLKPYLFFMLTKSQSPSKDLCGLKLLPAQVSQEDFWMEYRNYALLFLRS
jgi:hypothetical protein